MKQFFSFILIALTTITFGANKPSKKIKAQLLTDYSKFENQIKLLSRSGDEEALNWEEVESQFFKTRLTYKKIELFVTYLDREFVKDHINGAPLPHTERKAPDLVVLDPAGFQIMEEVLMERDAQTFLELSEKLYNHVHHLGTLLPSAALSERMVFEAMREEVVRLTAMGITGFDTPSTLNTLAECEEVLTSLETTITFYSDYIELSKKKELNDLFKHGHTFFVDRNYNNFNRFDFIKDVMNPLYKELLLIQKALFIETKDLVFNNEPSVNYHVTSIFDTDFLNYAYYSSYSNSGDEAKRIELGKLLFFDPILSHNNERACASCHHADKAFSDNKKTSFTFDGNDVLKRNSPGLINAVFNTRFFWDARAATPEEQVEHVLFNPKEFNTNYDEIAEKLNSCNTYIEKFNAAYPTINKINRYTLVASIGSYIQSLRSFDSEFDQAMRNEKIISDEIKEGFNIFTGKGKCATCHFIPTFAGNVPPLYVDTETEILGIPDVNDRNIAKLDDDLGRVANGRPKDTAPYNRRAFKTPTIRNIALTAPYMHNGVFESLEEVVDYYNIGGGHGWGIAPENATLGEDSLHLTDKEVKNLILFMEAMTDTTGLTSIPQTLPISTTQRLNSRIIGGKY